jgi:hypothetical protein
VLYILDGGNFFNKKNPIILPHSTSVLKQPERKKKAFNEMAYPSRRKLIELPKILKKTIAYNNSTMRISSLILMIYSQHICDTLCSQL